MPGFYLTDGSLSICICISGTQVYLLHLSRSPGSVSYPTCLLCPLKGLCPTFASSSQAAIPVPKRPKEFTELREAALVIRDSKGRILMRRCAHDERWAGLWDFPRFDVTQCNTSAAESKNVAAQFQVRFGKPIFVGKKIHELKHAVTRYRITLKSYEAELDSSIPGKWKSSVETLWVNPSKPSELALSSSGKRLWSWLSIWRQHRCVSVL